MNKLIFKSTNPDWNGTYTKAEVLKEMRDLQLDVSEDENAWIYWVLEHVFDCNDIDGKMEKFIAECAQLKALTLKLKDGTVTITKL